MVKGIVIGTGLLLVSAIAEAATLSGGTYPVEVYQGDRTYMAYWMLRVDGTAITGMSDWRPLYGIRQYLQPLTGTLRGNQLTINRNCSEPEHTVCEQTYQGTVSGNTINGTWSGTGGAGSWRLHLNQRL